MKKLSCALAAACAWMLVLASCKMPLLTKEMIEVAKDSSGLVAASANKTISLSWVADPTAISYTLRYTVNGTVPSANNGMTLKDANAPVVLTNLVNGNLHCFELEASYPDGTVKAIGQANSIPLSERSLAPSVTVDGAYLRVRWPLIAGGDKFKVFRKEGANGYFSLRAEVTGGEFLDTNVLPDRIYYYAVEAASGSEVRSVAGSGRTAFASSMTDELDSIDLYSLAPTDMYFYLSRVVVDADGRYAYVSATACPKVSGAKPYEGHVLVLDLKTPGLPVVGRVKLPAPSDRAGAIAISGDYLFVGSWNTLYMYDVSSLPSAGTAPIGSWAVPGGEVTDVCVKDNRLYVTGMYSKQLCTAEFSAAGISGLGNRSLAGQPRDIVVHGDYAFVSYSIYSSGYTTYVDRIDISNPASLPAPSGGYSSSAYGSTSCMALDYPYIYIDALGSSSSSVLALDVSSTSTITVAGSFAANGCIRKMAVYGSYIVTTEQPTGMRTFCVPDMAHARSQKTINLPDSDPEDFCMYGNRAIVLNSNTGLATASVVDPGVGGGSVVFSEAGTSGIGTTVSGDSCFALEFVQQNPDTYRLTEYDVGDCESIQKLREISLPFIAQDVAVSGRYAYIAEFLFASQAGRLRVMDLETEELLPPGATTGMIDDIALFGSYAFVAEGVRGVEIMDLGDPEAPLLVAKISTPGPASSVSFSGSYAYVAMGISGLGVYDIRDPTRPMLVQVVGGMEKAQDVAIYGSYAYVADYRNLRVVNISDPRAAFVKASLPFDQALSSYSTGVREVEICGSRAVVDMADNGVFIVDVSLPELPSVLTTIPGTKYDNGLTASGSYLFMSASDGSVAKRMLAIKVF